MENFIKEFNFDYMAEDNGAEFERLISYTKICNSFPFWYTYLTEENWETIQKCFTCNMAQNVHTAVIFLRGLIVYLAATGEPELGDVVKIYDNFLP